MIKFYWNTKHFFQEIVWQLLGINLSFYMAWTIFLSGNASFTYNEPEYLSLFIKMRNSPRCVLSGAILTKTNHSLFEVKCFFHRQLTSGVCVSFLYNCQLRDLCVLNSSPFIFNIVNADVYFFSYFGVFLRFPHPFYLFMFLF